jgi:hypothetical protein
MEPDDRFTIITSELLEMVGISLELRDHDLENEEYWIGFCDAICVLLGDLAGKKPVIVDQERYMKFMDMRMETEIENLFEDDQL